MIKTVLNEIALLTNKLGWNVYFIYDDNGTICGLILGDGNVLEHVSPIEEEGATVLPFTPKDPI